MGAMVVENIDGREWSLTIWNQHIGWYSIVTRKSYLYLPGPITIALLLEKHLRLIAVRGCRRWHQHTVEYLLARYTFPFLKIPEPAIVPGHGIS
jgi:hypothetical protein